MKKIFILIFLAVICLPILCMAEPKTKDGWRIYSDPQNRFIFSYPADFGVPRSDIRLDMPEGDLGESIYFPDFSHGFRQGKTILEGNFVIRRGRIWVGAQALGGLYDPIVLGALIDTFPSALQDKLRKQADSLTAINFADELQKQEHIRIDDPSLDGLSSQQKQAIIQLDKMRNSNPKLISCEVINNTVIFHKKVVAKFGQLNKSQHVYGAIAFHKGFFSSVQLIRITNDPPDDKLLEIMAEVVRSFEELI